jgi:alkaline phosphatase
MESLDYTALAKTYNIDFQIPDSAATATALLSGHKTKFFTMGLSGEVRFSECDSLGDDDKKQMFSSESDNKLSESVHMKASRAGIATGLGRV